MLLQKNCAWCDGSIEDVKLMMQKARTRSDSIALTHTGNVSDALLPHSFERTHPAKLEYDHHDYRSNLSATLALSLKYNPIIYMCLFEKEYNENVIRVVDPYHYACLIAFFNQRHKVKSSLASIRSFARELITAYQHRATHAQYNITHEFEKEMLPWDKQISLQGSSATIPLKITAAKFLQDRHNIILSSNTREIERFFIDSWQTIFTVANLGLSRLDLSQHLMTLPPEFTPYDFYVREIGDKDHPGEFCLALPLSAPGMPSWLCCSPSKWSPVFKDMAPAH